MVEYITMKKASIKDVLPEYPATRHLPWKPNNKSDRVASFEEAAVIFVGDRTCVQEKIDGANCGMAYIDGHPVVRNRTKVLRKGQELKNPSKAQFASAWNWMHQNKAKFDILAEQGPYSVYGEWMIQQHGMVYDTLPDWFIAFDVYDWEKCHYIDPEKADKVLLNSGFSQVSNLFFGKLDSYETLEQLSNEKSGFTASGQREGIVVKVGNGDSITTKFKMVRQGFDQGCLLGDEIKRNKRG
jgi:hypothetical protein